MSKEYSKRWHDDPKNADKILTQRLGKYGITAEQYNKMLAEQNGVCAICGRPPKTKRLHVDHDHKTGKIRALLCMMCNTKLGIIEHPKKIYLDYIKKWSEIQLAKNPKNRFLSKS